MPVYRYYKNIQTFGDRIVIDGKELHHLKNVVRQSKGDRVEIINGYGLLAKGIIEHLNHKEAVISIQSQFQSVKDNFDIKIAIASLAPAKEELLCEKLTELGVSSIFFFKGDLSKKQPSISERMNAHAVSALKQSGRLFMPTIEVIENIEKLPFDEASWYCHLETEIKQQPFIQHRKHMVVVGPESGFSDREKRILSERAKPVCLSPYTLRAETAAIVASGLACRAASIN